MFIYCWGVLLQRTQRSRKLEVPMEAKPKVNMEMNTTSLKMLKKRVNMKRLWRMREER